MSDDRLQQLRRAWEAGDPGAGAAYLQACVRDGSLTQERLELAAYAGDPAAAQASDVEAPEDLEAWILGFRARDELAYLRAAVHAVEVAVPVYEAAASDDRRAGRLIAALLELLDAPERPLSMDLIEQTQEFLTQILDRGGSLGPQGGRAAQAVFALALILSGRIAAARGSDPAAGPWVRQVLDEPMDDPQGLLLAVQGAAEATDPGAVRRWSARRVAAWALGDCRPT